MVLEGSSPSWQGKPGAWLSCGLVDSSLRCGRSYSYHSGLGTEAEGGGGVSHIQLFESRSLDPFLLVAAASGSVLFTFSCHSGNIPDSSNLKEKGFIQAHNFRVQSSRKRRRGRSNSKRLLLHHSSRHS